MLKNWLCAEFDHVQLDLNHLKTGSGNRFFGGILLLFWSWWGLLGSRVGDQPMGVEDEVG